MLCAVCTMHVETRSVEFLVEPQNQGRQFSLISSQNQWRRFSPVLSSKSDVTVSPGLASKPVVAAFLVWASKLAATVW
jgi:hypothetical protein